MDISEHFTFERQRFGAGFKGKAVLFLDQN